MAGCLIYGWASFSGAGDGKGVGRWAAIEPDQRRPILYRAVARYGLAVATVAAASMAMLEVESLAEKPLAFPFYAAVVISAWIGTGPGFLAVILGSLLFGRRDRRAEDMWDELYVRSNTGLGRAAAVAH